MIRAAQVAAVFSLALLAAQPLSAGGSTQSKNAALSTAHPLATKAGLSVLQRGNAADAAVAVALVLAVVRPQSGNLAGGGFLTYYDAETRGVWTLDFRETAPRTATVHTRTGASAAGVPGTLAGLHALHEKFGSRPWKELVAPAILLAREGPREDPELAADIATALRDRKLTLPALPRPELAQTLQRIAERGGRDLYEGALAKQLVEGARAEGGVIGFRDLRDYAPIWRAPLKFNYGPYEIYSVPPPAGGGLVIGETLNILAGDDLAKLGFQTPAALYLLIEAQRRANIDGLRYVADPLNARIPYRELVSAARGAQWRKTIGDRVAATVTLAEPNDLVATTSEHTTHFTIADEAGNVIAFSTSLGDDFGSGVLVPSLGIFLNGANAHFTTSPNEIEPGKRAASPLAPTIILRDGKPFLALGSSGGSASATTVLQVFLNIVVYGKTLSQAVEAPRYHHAALPDELVVERGRAPQATIDALNERGHGVKFREAIGDVHAILFEKGQLIAVADPRRGGAAGGF